MHFFGWGPDVVANLTTTGLLKANDHAHRIAAAQAKAQAQRAAQNGR